MSLAEAVLEYADGLEKKAAAGMYLGDVAKALSKVSESLKLLVKASKSDTPASVINTSQGGIIIPAPGVMSPDLMRLQALHDANEARSAARKVESNMGMMTELVNGSSDGDHIIVPDDMPVGAKTVQSGQVYVLGPDKRLHYSEEETLKYTSGKV